MRVAIAAVRTDVWLPFRLLADRWSIARVLLTTVSWHRSISAHADRLMGSADLRWGVDGVCKIMPLQLSQ